MQWALGVNFQNAENIFSFHVTHHVPNKRVQLSEVDRVFYFDAVSKEKCCRIDLGNLGVSDRYIFIVTDHNLDFFE